MRGTYTKTGILPLGAIVVLAVVLGVVFVGDPTPVVKVAYPTMECKEVVMADPGFDCDNLPETYEVMWVSPAYRPEEGQ